LGTWTEFDVQPDAEVPGIINAPGTDIVLASWSMEIFFQD
jgi:hypothetical protein